MLRLLLLVILVILLSGTIYRFLLKRVARVKRELESEDTPPEETLHELKEKKKQLKADLAEEMREAERKYKQAEKFGRQL